MEGYVKKEKVLQIVHGYCHTKDGKECGPDDILELYNELKDLDEEPVKPIAPKYKPPRMIPCVCGRKRTETWWDSNKDNKGWFRKCYHCGFEGERVPTLIRLNYGWNLAVLSELRKRRENTDDM